MKLNTMFEGFNTNVPRGYIEHYIKEDESNITVYAFNVIIEIKLKLWGLIIGSGWEFYSWIDSFIEELESKISMEHYFKKIGWENAYTIIRSIGLSAPTSKKTRTLNTYWKR